MDRAALTTGAAPGVADPAQPVAAKFGVPPAQTNGPNSYVMGHRQQYPAPPVTRLCIACGTVRDCDPALPCGECGASSFHLIPLPPHAA